eukprot:604908-Amphidinium_carterae.3
MVEVLKHPQCRLDSAHASHHLKGNGCRRAMKMWGWTSPPTAEPDSAQRPCHRLSRVQSL